MREHFLDYKWFYVIGIIALSLIGFWIWYEYAYPCVYGHYEETIHYIYDANTGISTPYWSNDFYCDCRTVRDSIK